MTLMVLKLTKTICPVHHPDLGIRAVIGALELMPLGSDVALVLMLPQPEPNSQEIGGLWAHLEPVVGQPTGEDHLAQEVLDNLKPEIRLRRRIPEDGEEEEETNGPGILKTLAVTLVPPIFATGSKKTLLKRRKKRRKLNP